MQVELPPIPQSNAAAAARPWPWPVVAPPSVVEKNKRMVHDFATMERGQIAVLILKAEADMTTPVSARWLPTAIELLFENPTRRINLFVEPKFRKKWRDKLYLVLYNGAGDIVKGAISPKSAIPVPMLPA